MNRDEVTPHDSRVLPPRECCGSGLWHFYLRFFMTVTHLSRCVPLQSLTPRAGLNCTRCTIFHVYKGPTLHLFGN